VENHGGRRGKTGLVRWLFDPRASEYATRTGQLQYWLIVRIGLALAVVGVLLAVFAKSA
jgi:hypothetical protein